ncbi:MAG: glutamine-hydrolyzing GMP synthase [Candidatus Margulisiibacteriota bacterium]|nr:glutamine-hydrolyzing GMP synthase [Candidatus Margulisiibacteriota bacterium]
MAQKHDLVVVLDFGAQYSMLIARRVRECNVYCEVLPHDIPVSELKKRNVRGIIVSGGPASVYEKDAPKADPALWNCGIPILGICYGLQLMTKELGGEVKQGEKKEYGKADPLIDDETNIFAGLPNKIKSWMSHGDTVASLPEGFKQLAHTDNTKFAAIGNAEKKLFGVQFHPEVVHTPKGIEILKNFVYIVCNCKPTWTTANFIEEQVKDIRTRVGKEKILLALSGGVDSTTVAALIQKAIGNQLTCMFIDQGFMRKNEAKKINELFTSKFKINFIHIDAAKRFFDKLKGVIDPEKKRKIIGENFIRTFEEEAKKLGDIPYLAQGTLYPDVIESAVPGTTTGKVAKKIKTHHNVGGLPEKMGFKLIEPLRLLFKDEVRALGRGLGVPDEIISRQPFPGPGLSIRIIGEVTKERVKILQEVDDIVVSEIKEAGLYKKLWQSFAVLLPIRTVGVMGDKRTYLNTVAIRAVESKDAMTADWARLPYELLEKISNRIVNETPEVNRVVYDISSKPPSTIEWE